LKKEKILSQAGALNKHPDKITSPVFLKYDFFDPLDKVQIKYEMLRANKADKAKVSEICKQFSYSRDGFYRVLRKFKANGIAGLFEPFCKKKNTVINNRDITNMIIREKVKQADISGNKLAQKINSTFKTNFGKRTIEKALNSLGIGKKTLK